jgi:hypothetical protein
MAENLGSVYADVMLRLDKLDKSIVQVSTKMHNLGKIMQKPSEDADNAFSGMGKKVQGVLSKLSGTTAGQFSSMAKTIQGAFMALPIIGIIQMIAGTIKNIFNGISSWVENTSAKYRENQMEVAKLNAVIQTTGAAAWTSTRELRAQADEIAAATGRTSNEIMKMQSVLLGFRSITGEVFDRTTKAIVDMAAVMGGDLASAANIVGKAIDTPVQGMSALSRQGFVFSKSQKELVENLESTGRHLEAMEVILQEIETTFAGTAEAINEANGATSRLEAAEKKLAEARGAQTSGLSDFFKNLKAGRKEERAEAIKYENELKESNKRIANNYKDETEHLMALQKKLNEMKLDGSDEQDVMQLESITVKYRLELDRTQAEDALRLAKNSVKEYEMELKSASMELDRMGNIEYDTRLKAMEAAQQQLDKQNELIESHKIETAEIQRKRLALMSEVDAMDAILKVAKGAAEASKRANEIAAIQEESKINKQIDRHRDLASAYLRETKILEEQLAAITAVGVTSDLSTNIQLSRTEELRYQYAKAIENYKKYAYALSSGGGGSSSTKTLLEQIREAQAQFMNLQKTIDAEVKATTAENTAERVAAEKEANEKIIQARQNMVSRIQGLVQGAGLAMGPEFDIMIAGIKELEKELGEIGRKEFYATYDKQNGELKELTSSSYKLRQAEYEREQQALKSSVAYITATEKEREEMEKLLVQVQKMRTNPFRNWETGLQYVMQNVQALSGVMSAVGDLMIAMEQNQTEELRRELEERHEMWEKELEKKYDGLYLELEREHQLRLWQEGLIAAETQEQLEVELERAKKSLNERLMLEATNALKRKKIDDEYAAKKLALDNQMAAEKKALEAKQAKEKAELDYSVAVSQWNNQIIQAIAGTAQAIVQAIAGTPWPWSIPLAAAAGGMGAVQVATIRANKPKLQTFADGGIVAGSSYSGDNILVRANSGERLVTQQQQERMTDILDGKRSLNDNPIQVALTVMMDTQVFAEAVVDVVNNGGALIDLQRGTK